MGSFYKCLSILRKTRTSKTWARMEKFRSNPIVEADAAGYLLDVGVYFFAEVCDFVYESNF